MPRGDKTGPNGQGQMTGRGMGYCNGYENPGYMNGERAGRGFARGRGRGLGRGNGRGYGRNFNYGYGYRDDFPTASPVSEKTYIENSINVLEEQLKNLKERLNKLTNE